MATRNAPATLPADDEIPPAPEPSPPPAPSPAPGEIPLGGGSAPDPDYVDDPMAHLREDREDPAPEGGEFKLGEGSAPTPLRQRKG